MWQRLGRFGTISEFWKVFTELSPEGIREEAERRYRLLILGAAESGKTTLARALAGGEEGRAAAADVLFEIDTSGDEDAASGGALGSVLPPADLYLYTVDATEGLSEADRSAIAALRHRGHQCCVFFNKCDLVPQITELKYQAFAALGDVPADRVAFGSACRTADVSLLGSQLLLPALPGLRFALPRRLAALRPVVADAVIVETARVNAEFALLSSLPANIPVVGGLLGGGADFLVLTKNQAIMLFKLAALHGRDLRSKSALAMEIVPVVGAAFLWRTVARELVGMLPGVVSAVPKTAIGYVGTYIVGKTAQYYFALGIRPNSHLVQQFAHEASTRWRRLGEWRAARTPEDFWPTKSDLER